MSDEDWIEIGRLWGACRAWLRMHGEWSMEIEPWGVYGAQVLRLTRLGETRWTDLGETLTKRLRKALEYMASVDGGGGVSVKIGPPFEELTPDEQEAIRAWLRGHGLDPKDVPTTGINHEPRRRQYRITVAVRGEHGLLVSDRNGDLLTHDTFVADTVPLPWPTREVA